MNKERCPYCSRPMMKNRHVFNRGLAAILLKATERYGEGEPFHLIKDLQLTHNQVNNFQKLKYWGLVGKHYERGKRKGGYWYLTSKAGEVIREDCGIPKEVVTFNNKVIEKSERLIFFKDAYGSCFYDLPGKWAKRAFVSAGSQRKLF